MRRASFSSKPSPLSVAQIRELSFRLCEDDEVRAAALLVLASDMRERGADFPYFVVRQTAFSQCGDGAIDAQSDLLRSELCGKKGGAA